MKFSNFSFCVILALLIATSISQNQISVSDLVQDLLTVTSQPLQRPISEKKFAIGFNANVDAISPAISILTELLSKHELSIDSFEPKDHVEIETLEQLISTFLFYYQKGAAGERFVTNSELWEEIAEIAVNYDKTTLFVGGNAALMANNAVKFGSSVLLGGHPGKIFKDLIDDRVIIADDLGKKKEKDCILEEEEEEEEEKEEEKEEELKEEENKEEQEQEEKEKSKKKNKKKASKKEKKKKESKKEKKKKKKKKKLKKKNKKEKKQSKCQKTKEIKDEIHLILEYEKDSEFSKYKSPRANRFIISNDYTNARMETMKAFYKTIPKFKPTDMVITGLHLGDGLPAKERNLGLKKLSKYLVKTTKDIPIHLETASIGYQEYMDEIFKQIIPNVDSLGLNEQEASSIAIALGWDQERIDKIAASISDPTEIARLAKEIFAFHSGKRLSRVHFHCLGWHMIIQKKDSLWEDAFQTVAAGSLRASMQACGLDREQLDKNPQFVKKNYKLLAEPINTDAFKEIEPSFETKFVKQLELDDLDLFWVQVAVCNKPVKTVGLGDAISITGFANSEFNIPKQEEKQEEKKTNIKQEL
ncbi:adp-dependent glucokinase [Anaeramoeba flamelloides]|uniref:Adp-dependent glucokinase n=1 Tax=Anaeramoeba flamelloides TaxID=1746091 RepID=A0ABQ8X8P9_9EUKA|nr:adp-dependent glucokinase [Anaeramoeba flamelloides]